MDDRKIKNPLSKMSYMNLFGLQNLGNTCFINACLESLRFIRLFTHVFTSDEYIEVLDRKSSTIGQFCKETAFLYKNLELGTGTFSPFEMKSLLKEYCPLYQEGAQFDSSEFIEFLLTNLHEELKSRRNGASIVSTLCFGKILLRFSCLRCQNNWTSEDVFKVLRVPAIENSSLLDCIHKSLENEEIRDYKCQNCATPQILLKYQEIEVLPKIMIVHLMRFITTFNGVEKLDNVVRIPEMLELPVKGNVKKYRLCSFIVTHRYGSLNRLLRKFRYAEAKMAIVQQKARLWFLESKSIATVQRIIRLEYRNYRSPNKNFIKRWYMQLRSENLPH
ncbi:Putative ubiquitin carboxyl-terminal hydrolase 50 [Araneus ventricosus]|uniref:Ubiquitin carboxyl-terminal hydrolase 50 n=1 Tax=Araneus ventricosus TaxID=182803 RepID=A0A4Y2M565_ARAVE|nr:Putative ubiquitin carboxyl-terminal hydrolase 50 [Araneus ventricosus]